MKNTKSTIPLKLRAELAEDPAYSYCCLTGEAATSSDRIEWHHNLKFAGKNQQRRFCILPIKASIHRKADTREIRERLNWVMWSRATLEEIAEFSKATNYAHELQRLVAKFGTYKPPMMKKVSEPTKDGEKPLWYGINADRQAKLLKCCRFHNDKEGIKYSPRGLVDTLIDEHYEEVIHLEEEFSDEATSSGVY